MKINIIYLLIILQLGMSRLKKVNGSTYKFITIFTSVETAHTERERERERERWRWIVL